MSEIERRFIEFGELRAETGFSGNRLAGYAAVFNSLTDARMFGGAFREQVAPGAFSRALKSGADVVALFNHNPDNILGRKSNRTLNLREDDKGLWSEVTLPDTTQARDLYRLVERGDIHQMSFTFTIQPGGETWERQGKMAVRTLTSVDLMDVSIVTTPAYPATSVAARQMAVEILSGANKGDVERAKRRRERVLQLLELR